MIRYCCGVATVFRNCATRAAPAAQVKAASQAASVTEAWRKMPAPFQPQGISPQQCCPRTASSAMHSGLPCVAGNSQSRACRSRFP